MSCGGRGICGCGHERCAVNAWWFSFGLVWRLISFEIAERDPRRSRTDEKWLARIGMVS
jgi:hypothetical protein